MFEQQENVTTVVGHAPLSNTGQPEPANTSQPEPANTSQPATTVGHAPQPVHTPYITHPDTTLSSSRFAEPQNSSQIELLKRKSVPNNTQQDTNYCVRVWEEWVMHRSKTYNDNIPALVTMNTVDLQLWMISFVLEARKKKRTTILSRHTAPLVQWYHEISESKWHGQS